MNEKQLIKKDNLIAGNTWKVALGHWLTEICNENQQHLKLKAQRLIPFSLSIYERLITNVWELYHCTISRWYCFFFFHWKEERFDKGLVRTTQIKSLLDLCCCARLLIKTWLKFTKINLIGICKDLLMCGSRIIY